MSIVTKRGDRGTTALMYNRQVPKRHPRVEAYGALDELNAAFGNNNFSEAAAQPVGHAFRRARVCVPRLTPAPPAP